MHKFQHSVLNIETWNENRGGIYSIYLDQLSSNRRNLYLEEFKIFKTICDNNITRNIMQHTLNKIKLINGFTNESDVEIVARIFSHIFKCSFYLIRKKTIYWTIDTDQRISIWVSRKQLNDYLNLNFVNIKNYYFLNHLLELYDYEN